MIPKVIHYCWFGRGPKSDLINKCIESWKNCCPEYKIIEWNEDNFDINFCEYTKQAYEAKKYAFVSDVARLYVIYKYGGIYLDTDVEVIAPINELLQYDAWFNWETERFINTGLGFGAKKGNEVVKFLLDDYLNKEFYKKNKKMDLTACTKINTLRLLQRVPELKRDSSTQIYNNIIYLNPGMHKKMLIHHAVSSWTDLSSSDIGEKPYKDSYIKRFFRNPKIFNFLEMHFSESIVDIYTILVYDVIDRGIIYFIKRYIRRFFYRKK